MKRVFAFLALAPSLAFASIQNWDSRIGLEESRAEYVVEAATSLESESGEGQSRCMQARNENMKLESAEFQGPQVLRFEVSSISVLGGACEGKILACRTEFSWFAYQDWGVKAVCETQAPAEGK